MKPFEWILGRHHKKCGHLHQPLEFALIRFEYRPRIQTLPENFQPLVD